MIEALFFKNVLWKTDRKNGIKLGGEYYSQ